MVTISINGAGYFDVVKNGTRIGNLANPTPCPVNGEAYVKYSGTIE